MHPARRPPRGPSDGPGAPGPVSGADPPVDLLPVAADAAVETDPSVADGAEDRAAQLLGHMAELPDALVAYVPAPDASPHDYDE
jgi:hypothetical protein